MAPFAHNVGDMMFRGPDAFYSYKSLDALPVFQCFCCAPATEADGVLFLLPVSFFLGCLFFYLELECGYNCIAYTKDALSPAVPKTKKKTAETVWQATRALNIHPKKASIHPEMCHEAVCVCGTRCSLHSLSKRSVCTAAVL